jgi:hypothetical protein
VVKALCCKPEGRRFKTRWDDLIFQFTKSFRPHQPLGPTQPLTEMSTKIRKIMFLRSGVRPVRKAICEPIVYTMCGTQILQPYRPSQGLLRGQLYFFSHQENRWEYCCPQETSCSLRGIYQRFGKPASTFRAEEWCGVLFLLCYATLAGCLHLQSVHG